MNHFEFVISSGKISPNTGRAAARFTINPIIMAAIESLYHSPSLEKKIGNVDTMDHFVRWLYLNPKVFYRTIRLAQYKANRNDHLRDNVARFSGFRHYTAGHRSHDQSPS